MFDTATNTLVTTIATAALNNAVVGFAFSPDGTRLYGTTRGSGVDIIDTATNTILSTVSTGAAAANVSGIAVTSDGTRAYVTNNVGNTVSVIDLATSTVATTITVGSGPAGIRITPDGLHAYVSDATAHTVSVIALDTFPAITTTTLPAGATGTTYAATIATTGTPAPQVTVTSGALPPGLTLDPATGAITGTPTTAGSFTFTVTAANTVSGIPSTATRTYTLVITAVLAKTGVDPSGGIGAAAALTLLGLGLLIGRRLARRRRTSEQRPA